MRHVTCLFVLGLLCGGAHAQSDFVVEQSAPAYGAAGVSLADTVAFSFAQEIGVSTDWDSRFVEAPRASLSIDGVSLCLNFAGPCGGGDDVPRHVRFRVSHQPDVDYTWLVYAVESAGGTPMAEPYALRYTTAPDAGEGTISGSVSAPVPAQKFLSSPASDMRPTLRTLAKGLRQRGRGHLVFDAAETDPEMNEARSLPSSPPQARVRTIGPKAAGNGPFTQVLLLDEFSIEETDWNIRGGDALIGSSGDYGVEFVRPGTYVPIAVRYTNGSNTTIDALGFHDPDGDGSPNAVEMGGGEQTGVDLQLFEFPRTTARAAPNLPVARDSAAHYAPDSQLRWVQAETGPRPNGTAYAWTYRFYSPSQDLGTTVTIDPLSADVDTTSGPGLLPEMGPIPEGFIDSDEALQIVLNDGGQDLVDSYPPDRLTTLLSGGNLFWTDAPIPSEEFWHARLIGHTSSSTETFERYLNIETGDVLPVELTRFAASTTDDAVLLRWRTATETNNAGFAVQHAPGDSTVAADWRTLQFVKGAGTTQRPQTYRVRTPDLPPGPHRFRLRQRDLDGTESFSDVAAVTLGLDAPLRLTPPSPNPARQAATLRFGVQTASTATVAVYDVLGRKVATLHDGPPPTGRMKTVRLDANRLPSGTYFVRLTAENRTQAQKLTVVE
ncbi:T9SS type A sorting domain-containing protein [Salinibacter grassmerensis]|uniref:T9SS type A sorting domain-containing protein n=1 Tax=Salinibacter grassmerensis TaxID=3040353 RepID=UPI0021E726C2|nr:T9SS type A sorting domain-containing protein [Salinibacter grassmerensis]